MGLNDKKVTFRKGASMETRVALIGIIVEDMEAAERINSLLHEYNQYVIGRMGLPYREKGISIISVVVNAEADIISTLAGKLGMINGVNVKTVYSKK
jgi:putative iron-only hydrogenase system regulator